MAHEKISAAVWNVKGIIFYLDKLLLINIER
jgi:hypothetical protein